MTSPRTPRQWNAGDAIPDDVEQVRDVHGRVWTQQWLRMDDGQKQWRLPGTRFGSSTESVTRAFGPVSEVLPETPEPPRETCDAATAWSDGVTTRCQLPPGHEGEHRDDRADVVNPLKAELAQAREDLEEARGWAKHGYEIGQRTCTWSDQGVAPRWLIESYRPVPASQSVPAVPVSSTGGKETGEAAEDGTEELSGAADWTEEPRFADFRAAYDYATGHFSTAIRAHAKVDRREAYRIWHTIQLGMEKIQRESSPLPDSETETETCPDGECNQGMCGGVSDSSGPCGGCCGCLGGCLDARTPALSGEALRDVEERDDAAGDLP